MGICSKLLDYITRHTIKPTEGNCKSEIFFESKHAHLCVLENLFLLMIFAIFDLLPRNVSSNLPLINDNDNAKDDD